MAPGNVLDPFASVTVSDTNATPVDFATIILTNAAGAATDANGTLTGTGLTETGAGSGIYNLAAVAPQALTSELNALTFHPAALPTGVTSETTGFTLSVRQLISRRRRQTAKRPSLKQRPHRRLRPRRAKSFCMARRRSIPLLMTAGRSTSWTMGLPATGHKQFPA